MCLLLRRCQAGRRGRCSGLSAELGQGWRGKGPRLGCGRPREPLCLAGRASVEGPPPARCFGPLQSRSCPVPFGKFLFLIHTASVTVAKWGSEAAGGHSGLVGAGPPAPPGPQHLAPGVLCAANLCPRRSCRHFLLGPALGSVAPANHSLTPVLCHVGRAFWVPWPPS